MQTDLKTRQQIIQGLQRLQIKQPGIEISPNKIYVQADPVKEYPDKNLATYGNPPVLLERSDQQPEAPWMIPVVSVKIPDKLNAAFERLIHKVAPKLDQASQIPGTLTVFNLDKDEEKGEEYVLYPPQ